MKTLLPLALAAILFINTAFSQNNIDSGLVAYFPFSGNSNNQAAGSNGLNYGTSLSSDRFGNPKSAYSFNGTSSYIDLQNAYDHAERSVSFWFNSSLIESTARFIYVSDFGNVVNGCTAVNLIRSNNIDKITFAVGYQRAEAPITANAWHHVLIRRTASECHIYLDCIEINHTTAGLAHSVDGLNKTFIGAGRYASNYFFSGSIDDIRVYNRCVSPQEAKILCSEENPCLNLITVQPINYKAKGGASAVFQALAKFSPANYQWQISTGNGFSNVANNCFYDHSCALTINIVGLNMDKNAFRCIVSTDQCTDTTSVAFLQVDATGGAVALHDTIYVHDTLYQNTSDTLFIQFKTGINIVDQLSLKVFPNPAKDRLNIDFGNFQNFNNYSVHIANALSQEVFSTPITQQIVNIDLSSFTGAGVYFVTLKDPNGNALITKNIILK